MLKFICSWQVVYLDRIYVQICVEDGIVVAGLYQMLL